MDARLVILIGTLSTASALWVSAQFPSPSFDGSKASGDVEELNCRDAGLAALDRGIAEIYANALMNWPPEILPEEKHQGKATADWYGTELTIRLESGGN